ESLAALSGKHVFALDIECRKRPFSSAVPEQMLDAGFVGARTCQIQRLVRGQQKNAIGGEVGGGGVLAVERHPRDGLASKAEATSRRLPSLGEGEAGHACSGDIGGGAI